MESELALNEVDDMLEPVAGATVIGTLDQSLQTAYCELVNIELEMDALATETKKHLLVQLGNTVAQWDGEDPREFMKRVGQQATFVNEAEAEHYFELISRWEERNTAFWYATKLTFKCFSRTIGIRSGFRVVNLGPKYQQA